MRGSPVAATSTPPSTAGLGPSHESRSPANAAGHWEGTFALPVSNSGSLNAFFGNILTMTTVLVVDDEPTIREIVVGYLDREGYKTLEAADGNRARELVECE